MAPPAKLKQTFDRSGVFVMFMISLAVLCIAEGEVQRTLSSVVEQVSGCFNETGLHLLASDWFPPSPVSVLLLQALMVTCTSPRNTTRVSRCLAGIYNVTGSPDLDSRLTFLQMPPLSAFQTAQDTICKVHEDLVRSLPCLAHVEQQVPICIKRRLYRQDTDPADIFQTCRIVETSTACQARTYGVCSLRTAEAVSATTRVFTPALCRHTYSITCSSASTCDDLKLFAAVLIFRTFVTITWRRTAL